MSTGKNKRLTPYWKPLSSLEPPEPFQYAHVKAVILYWEDHGTGLQYHIKEAEEMESVFKSLNYDTAIRPIPIFNSHSYVHQIMILQQLSISHRKKSGDAPTLLIVHYSGHGDMGDDYYNVDDSRNPRVVWRP